MGWSGLYLKIDLRTSMRYFVQIIHLQLSL
jgi:hypothetical protein